MTRRKVWRTFDARPRFGNNYVGLRNRIAILSEAYSYLNFERRVSATEAFVEEIMRFVAANADDIRTLTRSADAEWSRRDTVERRHLIGTAALPDCRWTSSLARSADGQSAVGKPMRTMVESVVTPTSMTVYDRFVSTATRRVPREYIVPVSAIGLHDSVARKLGARHSGGETRRRSAYPSSSS